MDKRKTSKFLSLILRHKPETIGISLDQNGWIEINILLDALRAHGHKIDRAALNDIVFTNNKQRFTIDGNRIRANQGHSLTIDLGLAAVAPPNTLFHGTAARFLEPILEKGLLKMQRHHVHLSSDRETARNVGMRHGKPVILEVDSNSMTQEGFIFYQSENGVWLVDQVPAAYLKVLQDTN